MRLWVPQALIGDPAVADFTETRIELAGAINETLSFRFAVRAVDEPVRLPSLRIAPLASASARIDPSVARMFLMHAVTTGRLPGWHIRTIPPSRRDSEPLDVLVPLDAPRGGLPDSLAPGRTYHIWVDLSIPKGTFEGSYATDIELVSLGSVVGSLRLDLTVWPLILPDEGDVIVIADLDHEALLGGGSDADATARVTATVRMLQAHGLTPVLPKLAPIVKVDVQGEVEIDWARFDEFVEPLLNGRAFENRIPLKLWPMPVANMFSPRRAGFSVPTTGRSRLLRGYLAQCADHFEKRGWLDRSYALAPPLPRAESAETARAFAQTAHRADERIAVVTRDPPQDMAPYGWAGYVPSPLADVVDIWMPPAQFYDGETMADQRVAGRRTWWAVDRPPYSGTLQINAPPAHVRVLTWQASRYDAEAIHLGTINRWPRTTPSPRPEDCVRLDPGVLIYPGAAFGLDEPVPSVRLKHLRRSIQDSAYRTLLREHGLGHVTEALTRSLAPYAGCDAYRTHFADGRPPGWVTDPLMYDLARRIMAEELIDATYGRRATQRTREMVRTATWRRFMQGTRRLATYVDGTRMRFAGSGPTWRAEVETTLTLANGTRRTVAGDISFGDLPTGWRVSQTSPSQVSVAPQGSRLVTLSAITDRLPTSADGLMLLPIEMNTEDGALRRIFARVACVTAVPFGGAIRIDGDLSDWPTGSANVASNFGLVLSDAGERGEDVLRRPSHATFGLVMRDGDSLYIAINSEFAAAAASTNARRNRIDYEDLVPVGGELVEVLIDPFNSGTRSPTDLYHIAVKPSGTYVAERGLAFDPPCGVRRPWPVAIDVGTRVRGDRWTVELRIPLASFEADATSQTIWGFSLTRFDASRQEFSAWSTGYGNPYDPLSLGNLYLP